MPRTNLLPNPNFAADVNGWTSLQGSTVSHLDFDGRSVAKVIKSALNNSGIVSSNFVSVSGSLPYAISGYVYVPSTQQTGNFVVSVEWYSYNSGTQVYTAITTLSSDIVTIEPGDGWIRLTQTGTSPSNATHAKFRVYQDNIGTSGKFFYVDWVLFEQAEYVGSFIDVLSQEEETEVVNRALTQYRDLNYITGLQLNADVALGDLVFNTIDEDQVVWICTDIGGWWTTASPELPDIPRGFEDGSYDVSGRYASRSLNLTGVFIPQNPSDVGVARDKLLQAINLVRQGAWLRTSEEPTRASFVRLSGQPQILTVNSRGKTEFSIGLRAGDPIKYKWDDTKVDGIAVESINLAGIADEYITRTIVNEGTAPVTVKLVFTGPMGAGSTVDVYHEDDDTSETLTVIEPLRGAGPVATVTFVEMTNNIVTLTTQEAHGLSVGEIVAVSGTSTGTSYSVNSSSTGVTITAVTDTLPYTINYEQPGSNTDIEKIASGGAISLVSPDEMIVDTYNRNVTVNGDTTGYRSKLDTLTDFITLHPGNNTLTFTDSVDQKSVSTKSYDPTTNIATLTTTGSHFMNVSDNITVVIPETATIAFKEITSDVITITTKTAHGFSAGDEVEVSTTLSTSVTNKEISGTTATLTVSDPAAISDGDTVLVELATSAPVISKSRVDDQVTLTTSSAHGFSNGDLVTIPFSVDSFVSKKSLTNNFVTITTSTIHDFSAGDEVTITLPETATVNSKQILGSEVTLVTTANHGFSVGDVVTVTLPKSATPTGTKTFGGAMSFKPSARASSGTTRTITTPSTHNFAIGDTVYVTSVGEAYNGTFAITGVDAGANTFTYTGASSLTESTASMSGEGNVTNTSKSYRVFLNTTAAHGCDVGDIITVSIGIADTATVSSQTADANSCTLTTSAAHKYAVGETITVSGISARYNGTFVLTAVDTSTLTYAFAGAVDSGSVAGSVINQTIRNGYNGTKVVDSVIDSDTLTYLYYGQDDYTTNANSGTSPTLTNDTNESIDGTVTLTAVIDNTMKYTKVV